MTKILLTLAVATILGGAVGPQARAAGGMDPDYQDILTDSKTAVGRTVDWQVRVRTVSKRFYTYALEVAYLPDPGDAPCKTCLVDVVFKGDPRESPRPSRFKPGQILNMRGIVLRLDSRPVVLASRLQARGGR